MIGWMKALYAVWPGIEIEHSGQLLARLREFEQINAMRGCVFRQSRFLALCAHRFHQLLEIDVNYAS